MPFSQKLSDEIYGSMLLGIPNSQFDKATAFLKNFENIKVRNVPPCRSRSFCRSVRRTTPLSCRAKKVSARSSRWRSSPSPTTSASWWS